MPDGDAAKSPEVAFRPVEPGETCAALELVFSNFSPEDRQRRLAQFLPLSPKDAVDGLWGAFRHGRLIAAALVQVQPGKTALVYPPRSATGESDVARDLLIHAVDRLPGRGVKLAQALVDDEAGADAESLASAGFSRASRLLYLVSVRTTFPDDPTAESLEFVPYSPSERARLASIVERTYVGSRDCPTIDRVREVEDVLAGYQAIGEFDPARWMIAQHHGSDVGCLLLADDAQNNQCELTYMGVVPEARGLGFGLSIVRRAQRLTKKARRERLVLAVDADNEPAIAVYSAAGFVTWDERCVFLRVF